METLSVSALQFALQHVAQKIIDSEELLTEIDTIIGDGDHGIGMKEGFTALKELLETAQYPDPLDLLKSCGITLLRTMGGASGVIFGTLFTGGHEAIKGKKTLTSDDLISFFDQSAKAIMKRGKAGPGDKTMLDALIPAVEEMRTVNKPVKDIKQVLLAAANGAKKGVEASKSMLPRTGRAKNFREEALGYPDPGAVSISIIFESLYNGIILYNSEEI